MKYTIIIAMIAISLLVALNTNAATKVVYEPAIKFIENDEGGEVYKFYDSDANVVCYRTNRTFSNAPISCVYLGKLN